MSVARHRTLRTSRPHWTRLKSVEGKEPCYFDIGEPEEWAIEWHEKPMPEYEEFRHLQFLLCGDLILKYHGEEQIGQIQPRLARAYFHGWESIARPSRSYLAAPESIRLKQRLASRTTMRRYDDWDYLLDRLAAIEPALTPELRLRRGFTVLAYGGIAFLVGVLALGGLPVGGALLVTGALASIFALFYWFWAANRVSIIHPAVCIFGLITSATWLLTALAKIITSQ